MRLRLALLLGATLGGVACAAPPREFTTYEVAELELTTDLAIATSPGAAATAADAGTAHEASASEGDPGAEPGAGVESGRIGLAREVAVECRLTPKEPIQLELIAAPVGTATQGALLEVSLRWTDFVGVTPTSFGRSTKGFHRFGEDARFDKAAPLSRVFRFDLDEPEARVLARRLVVSSRLHPVDLVAPELELRTGGARIDFPQRETHSLRRAPSRDLEACLAELEAVEPEELFLAAVHEALRDPAARVARLVAVLPEVPEGLHREALFGALHFLTGTTQGRSVARWQSWWETREVSAEHRGDADAP